MIHLLPNGFRDLGHEVWVSDQTPLEELKQRIDGFAPDLIITNGWGDAQTPDSKSWIKAYAKGRGIPHVYWSIEDPSFTDTFVIPLIQSVEPDFVFTLCPITVNRFRKMGIKAAQLDWGFQPSLHHPGPAEDNFRTDIALVANSYSWVFDTWNMDYRIESMKQLLCPLIETNTRVDIYGKGWEEIAPYIGMEINPAWLHGPLPYSDSKRVYRSAKVMIGLQNLPTQVTQRTFEVLAAGRLLLTSDTPAVRERFKPGRDLLVSSDRNTTLRLISHYLRADVERRAIGQNGLKAVQPHSYRERAQYILRVLRKENILNS